MFVFFVVYIIFTVWVIMPNYDFKKLNFKYISHSNDQLYKYNSGHVK